LAQALLTLAALTGAMTDTVHAAPPAGGPERTPVVTVMTVRDRDVNPPLEYVGRVEAIQAVDLRARVEGFLEKVHFAEGADVHAGDLLYTIEQASYQASYNADKARLADAQAALDVARQYLERLQAVRSGGVSASDIDTAVGVHLRAKAKLKEAEAAVDQSALDLSYTRIEAPIGGRIGRTTFTAGNLVGPSSGPLARLVQIDPIRVVFAVSETDVTEIKLARDTSRNHSPAEKLVPQIRFAGGEVYPTAGRMDFVDNQVDPATGTIAVRAVFDNPAGMLLPGQFVTVMVRRSKPRQMPLVPQSAVQEDREGRYVFVVDAENRAQQRRITTGEAIDTDWIVESGLMAGETIIVQGVQKVRPGQTVKPAAAQDAPKD